MHSYFGRTISITVTAVVLLGVTSAQGQIFVSRFLGDSTDNGRVGKYNLDGTPVNAALIPALLAPSGLTVSGEDLYVTQYFRPSITGNIGKYTTSGAVINSALISGLQQPAGIAVSGESLFVADFRGRVGAYTTSGATVNPSLISVGSARHVALSGTDLYVSSASDPAPGSNARIGKYTTSGATINANFISNLLLNDPSNMVVHEGHLYVTNAISDTISQYTTTGVLVNPALVAGLDQPIGLALFGGHLYVANFGNGTVGQYRLDGTPVNPALITGLGNPLDIAVVPEPSIGAFLTAAVGVLLGRRHASARSPVASALVQTSSLNRLGSIDPR